MSQSGNMVRYFMSRWPYFHELHGEKYLTYSTGHVYCSVCSSALDSQPFDILKILQ